MNYDLAALASIELSNALSDLNGFENLTESQKELRQDILDVLYSRGWRV